MSLLLIERLLHILGDPLLPVFPEHLQDGQALPVTDVPVPDYLGERFHDDRTTFRITLSPLVYVWPSKAIQIN